MNGILILTKTVYIYYLFLLPDSDKHSSIRCSVQSLSSYCCLLFWGLGGKVGTGRELRILWLFSLFTYNFSKKVGQSACMILGRDRYVPEGSVGEKFALMN